MCCICNVVQFDPSLSLKLTMPQFIGKIHKLILLQETFFSHLEVWGLYTRMFLKFWQQLIFQAEKWQEKLLSVRENFIDGVNLGQTSYLNLDKFGIGNNVPEGQVENADITDFFSNFYKSMFSIFTYSEYRKLEFQKSEIFKHPCFRYSLQVNIENTDV